MHALHAILVEIPQSPLEEKRRGNLSINDLEGEARRIAMTETEECQGKVFDWRTEKDAGAWKTDFPGNGVILGITKPKQFKNLLEKWKNRPLRAALQHLEWLQGCCSEEQLKRNIFQFNPSFICDAWLGNIPGFEKPTLFWFHAKIIVEIMAGDYTFDAQFLSLPDFSCRIRDKTAKDAIEHPERYALVFSDYHT